MDNAIHIVLASDGYYFPYIYVAVKTLFEHNKQEKVVVHYIQQDVAPKSLNTLVELGAQYGQEVDIIPFTLPETYECLPVFGAASKTTYAKFWFASMFPVLDRVLYLDPDVIVLDNIRDLYDTDFQGNLIAAVIENLPVYHREASLMDKDDNYINGGMVLCNLTAWREIGFEELALERLKDTTHNLNYDQGILNEICCGKIKVLHPKYAVLAEVFEFKNAEKIKRRYGFKSYYSQEEIDEALRNPAIVHFTGFFYGKPLSRKCTHPYAAYFQKMLKDAPFSYTLSSDEIDFKKKVRRFFLHHMPFRVYLTLERLLDARRKRIL